ADNRPSFSDACSQLLHLDNETGKIPDKELLEALVNSLKVITEEKLEIRTDLEGHLRLPSDSSKAPPGASLAGARVEEALKGAEKYELPEFVKSSPALAIEQLGQRSVFAGMALLTLGIAGYSKHMLKQKAPDGGCLPKAVA
ncbi:unnamed protein product, partial [Polarella glacialis]